VKKIVLVVLFILLFAVPLYAYWIPVIRPNFNDELFWLYDNGDATKRLEFELDGITTGNTRTWTVPDYDVVANGFIDWTADQGATNIHVGNLTGSPTFASVWLTDGDLVLSDTDESNILAIRYMTDLTANRFLYLYTGDATRTITLSGNPTLADWFDQGVKTTDDVVFATTGGVTIVGGNISGADVDTDLGTGNFTTTGDFQAGRTGVGGYQCTFLGNALFGAVGSAYGASAYFIAGESQSAQFFLYANEGNDNADKWRMGSAAGTNYLQIQNKTSGSFVDKLFLAPGGEIYMPAVYGDSHGGTGRAMYIQSNGQLTCDTSARRFKENIKDLSDTSWIYDLTPREADWKNSNVKADPVLIAEEVELVNPKLISHAPEYRYESHKKVGPDGEDETEDELVEVTEMNVPEGVQYYKLIVPMLKEIQKLRQEIDALGASLNGQK